MDVYDLVGIGFGPSNLALAAALHEHNLSAAPHERLTYRFVERQPAFSWHGGMLIEGATMQISFLKDLVTLRNPVSEFGFLSYLHAKDRLAAFINHQVLYPSRIEFHDYLEWVAARLGDSVSYGQNVVDVSPLNQELDELGVTTAGAGGRTLLRARNVAVATGLAPSLPVGTAQTGRIWHSEDLLLRLGNLHVSADPDFVVVGAGQSAAEAVDYLNRTFPAGRVHAVFARYGLSPADDSPFVNEIFDSSAVDTFFDSPTEVKESLMAYHRNTNYSVVDPELIKELYRRHYQELVTGEQHLRFRRMSRVLRLEPGAEVVDVEIEYLPTGAVDRVRADAVVYATGYRPADPQLVLGSTAGLCKQDSEGRLRVGLDYRVDTTESMRCGIYLQGATEHIHGLSSTLLSNAAVRAGQIVKSLVGRNLDRRSRDVRA